MQLWLLLVIVGLSALMLGSISGVVIGKTTIARMRGEHKPLFSRKEKLILLSIILVGVVCVLFAVFYEPPEPVFEDPWGEDMMLGDGEFYEGDSGGDSGGGGGGTVMARPPRGIRSGGVVIARG